MPKYFTQDILKVQLDPQMQKQLKNHVNEVQRKQQQHMRSRLEKDIDKIQRIKDIENKFVIWAEKKYEQNQAKFDKVEKNKEDHLNKIVKKCQDRDKFLSKKHEDFKIAKKKNMNAAWKKAEKFNDDIQSYYKSKRFMSRTAKASLSGASLHEHQPQSTKQPGRQTSKQKLLDSIKVMTNTSKIYGNNNSFVNVSANDNKINSTNNREIRYDKFARAHSSNLNEENVEEKNNLQILEKVRELRVRMERDRIQELGEKMQKIEQSRARRLKIKQRKTTKQQSLQRSRNLSSLDHHTKKQGSKPKKDKPTRLQSQHFYKKQSRIKDRAQDYKLKRNQMFQQHLIDGYEYLESFKVRHLKTVIAKNISYNAMEKKLYMERFIN